MITPPGSLLFLTEGSVPVGTGHLRRCATLARHLEKQGWQVLFQILGDPTQTLPEETLKIILGDLSWETTAEPKMPSLPVSSVILDVPVSSQKATAAWCQNQGLCCLALDYLQPDLLPDAVVTLKDLGGHMQAAFAAAGRPQAYHEGVDFAMMRPGITAQRNHINMPGRNGVLDVLVSLGGADPQRLTLEAMDLLRPWRNRLDRVIIVLGPGVGPELQQQATHDARQLDFQVVKAPPDFDELLASTDLVLCNGGGTLLESLCLGRLVAVLPQTEAETAFAEAFCQMGACVWAREVGQIIETTEQERLEFAQCAGSIVDGKGLGRLAAVIADLANPPKPSPDV